MATVTSTGIGSGLDITGIVAQLVAAESRPVEVRLGLKEASAQAKLSAFGSMKSSLSVFRDALEDMRDIDSFLVRKASTASDAPYTVSADATATPASYAVEVVNPAQAQKLTSGSFASSETVVGTGTLQITVGTDGFVVGIDSENNTLAGIRDAINESSFNTGVNASIVNATAGSYLVFTAASTGLSNTIIVNQSGGDGGLSALEYDPPNTLFSLTETTPAADALIRIDGFDVSSESNSISTAVEGVTIDLVSADPGQTDTLTVSNDEASARATINTFIATYNQLVDVFDGLASFDADTQLSGPLFGDSTLRNIESQIRRELTDVVTGIEADFTTLTDIGIGLGLDGKLILDDARLSTALADEFTKVGDLFGATDGVAVRTHALIESYLASDGALEARTDGLNSQIADINDERTSLSQRLVSLEARLLSQFNAMDALLANLSITSSFLNQQLANLPGSTPPGST